MKRKIDTVVRSSDSDGRSLDSVHLKSRLPSARVTKHRAKKRSVLARVPVR